MQRTEKVALNNNKIDFNHFTDYTLYCIVCDNHLVILKKKNSIEKKTK